MSVRTVDFISAYIHCYYCLIIFVANNDLNKQISKKYKVLEPELIKLLDIGALVGGPCKRYGAINNHDIGKANEHLQSLA